MNRFGARRITLEWWLVVILSSMIVLALIQGRIGERLDGLVYDQLLQLARHDPDPAILLVTIDSQSLQEAGRWPWPRDRHAALIERLADAGARAIAYDVLFVEPSPQDDALARAMQRAGSVYLPHLLDSPGWDGARFQLLPPVPPLRAAAAGLGHVNLRADADGRIRRVDLVERDGARKWPHLMAALGRDLGDGGGADDPPTGRVLIPFAGPAGTYPALSAAAVLRGEAPAELVRGRIVLVGASAQGLGDRHPVPGAGIEGVMPGVEIQANLLDALLHDRLIVEGGLAARIAAGLLPLWLLLLSLRRLRPFANILLAVALSILVLAASAVLLLSFRVWIAPTPALIGLLLVYPFWGWRRLSAVSAYMVEELERLRDEPEGLASLRMMPSPTDPVMRETMLLGETVTQLRMTRRFLRDSMDRLPDAFFVLEPDGDIALANRSAHDLLDAHSIASAPPGFRDLLAGLHRNRPGDWRHWPPSDVGDRFEATSRDDRTFDVLIAPFRDEAEKTGGWVARLSDVTAFKTAQRQRDDMLRFLTHDIRSPQASILALTSTAAPTQIAPDLGAQIDRYARRTLELADGVVHLARAELLAYEPAPLDLVDLLKDAIDELWPQLSQRKMEIIIRGDEADLPVSGDASLLTRAIINLIDNAIKYSPPESRIECALGSATVASEPMAFCRISDQGEGVDGEKLASLFRRFERRSASASVGSGAGLGLSFVETVLARHGGDVSVESERGRGSAFTLRLPLASARGA